MRASSTPSRLELHRLKYTQSGGRGALLRIDELSRHEKEILQREVLQDIRIKHIDFTGDQDEQVFDRVQVEVYSAWGVMCPHPASARDNKHAVKGVANCAACGCAVFPTPQQRRAAGGK